MTYNIPSHMLDALDRYVKSGIPPERFLTAVLENDFLEVVQRADDCNCYLLQDYAQYVYWELPGICHGSPEKVAAWMKKKQAEVTLAETYRQDAIQDSYEQTDSFGKERL
jgi:hypothetical protein